MITKASNININNTLVNKELKNLESFFSILNDSIKLGTKYNPNNKYESNFKGYYAIGNEIFGKKPKKEDILSIIKQLEDEISSLSGYVKEYKKLLKGLYGEK